LRNEGRSPKKAAEELLGMSTAEMNELLFVHKINFNNLPSWQKRGIGIYWKEYNKTAINPITKKPTIARRRRLHRDLELPMKDAYSGFVRRLAESEK
jgi:tRNA(His) 5'-end guanylyltransferase